MLLCSVTVFVGVQFCDEKYTAYSLNRSCVQCSQLCTCVQCIPLVNMKKNMDSSEVDFALLLLAEKQAAISKKKNGEPTNEQANTQMSNYSIMRSYFRCFTTITRLINHSIDPSSFNRSIAIDQSLDRSIKRKITQSIYHPIGLDRSLNFDQLITRSIN